MTLPMRLMAAATLALLAAPAAAAPPASGDKAAVRAAVETLFDAWREADPKKADAVLDPNFRLLTMRNCPAGAHIDPDTRERLLSVIGRIARGAWDDRLVSSTVHVDPSGIAVLWGHYAFAIEGKPSHHGVVTLQLYRGKDGWKIASFADTHLWNDPKQGAESCANPG